MIISRSLTSSTSGSILFDPAGVIREVQRLVPLRIDVDAVFGRRHVDQHRDFPAFEITLQVAFRLSHGGHAHNVNQDNCNQ